MFPVTIAHALDPLPAAPGHLEVAVDTVLDVHTTRPPGDILLFLTGQDEIDRTARAPSGGGGVGSSVT